jgi:hypothetical protein
VCCEDESQHKNKCQQAGGCVDAREHASRRLLDTSLTHNTGNQKVIFMDHQTLAVTDFQEFVIGMMKVVTTTIIGDLDLQPADQRNTEAHLTLREAGEGTNQGHQCQEVCAQSA